MWKEKRMTVPAEGWEEQQGSSEEGGRRKNKIAASYGSKGKDQVLSRVSSAHSIWQAAEGMFCTEL